MKKWVCKLFPVHFSSIPKLVGFFIRQVLECVPRGSGIPFESRFQTELRELD